MGQIKITSSHHYFDCEYIEDDVLDEMIKYQEYKICGADYQWIDYVMEGQPSEIQIFSKAIKSSDKFHVEFKLKDENVIIDYVAF